MPKQIHSPPNAPPALGPYSVATEANGMVFVSGQVGIDPATGRAASDDVAGQTRQIMQNVGAILDDLGLGLEDVVKTSIFLADIDDFGIVNEVYAEFFADSNPARSTFQVGALPGGYRVEIEAIAAR